METAPVMLAVVAPPARRATPGATTEVLVNAPAQPSVWSSSFASAALRRIESIPPRAAAFEFVGC